MPVVERYGQPKVEQQPLARAVRTNAPGPEVFGAELGETLERIGSTLGNKIADEARQRAIETDNLAFDGAVVGWKHQNIYDAKTGVLNTVKGRDALGLSESVGQAYDTFTGELLAKMPPASRRLAQHRAQQHRAEIIGTLDTYASKQSDVYENAVTSDWLEKSVGMAAQHAGAGNVAGIAEELHKQTLIIEGFAQHTHLPPELKAGMLDKARTQTHAVVIEEMLAQGRDQDAQAYFDAAKDEINGTRLAGIEAKLETGSSEGNGLRASEAIWQQLGPKSETDPIALDRMEDVAREQFANNPRALKATIGFLRERKAGVDASRKEREEAIAGSLWQAAAAGAPLAQLRTMPAYLTAPGRVQAQISDYIVNRAERVASRAAAEESRAYTRESRAYTREQRAENRRDQEGLFMYYQYAKPDVLDKMSDAQLWALVPSIGERNVARLLEDKNKFKADPKTIDDFRSDESVINGVLEQAKIDPSPGKDKTDDRANVGFFREQVAAEQTRVQHITKKKVTNEELESIAKRVLGRQVISMKSGWFSTYPSSKPLYNAVIGDVPRADYDAIAQEFKRGGVPTPSDGQILQAWKLAMAQKKR